MSEEKLVLPGDGTREAMKLLNDHFPAKIAWGKYVAVKLALKSRTTNSRLVRQEMQRLGLLGKEAAKEMWLGVVFRELGREKILKKTGNKFKYSDADRNIHDREINEWELNEEADLTTYRIEPVTK